MQETTIIYGPPGTGKTKTLMDIVDQEIMAGTPPDKIAFVSFTRRAVAEGIQRASERFMLSNDDLPWFRTLHSAAYRAKGLRSNELMASKDYDELGASMGVRFSKKNFDVDGDAWLDKDTTLDGDILMSIYSWARSVKADVDTAIHKYHENRGSLDSDLIKTFFSWLEAYKSDTRKFDFSDMLDDAPSVDVDVAIIDESQDCTPQQWNAARSMFGNASKWYVAGDDDQAIYTWAGASVETLMNMKGHRSVLSQSMRVPVAVYDVAKRVVSKISHRVDKNWIPRSDKGSVSTSTIECWDPGHADYGSWLVLARCQRSLNPIKIKLESLGVPFIFNGESIMNRKGIVAILSYERLRRGSHITWEKLVNLMKFIDIECLDNTGSDKLESVIWDDIRWPDAVTRNLTWIDLTNRGLFNVSERDAAFVRLARERGEKLTANPRVAVSTIHSAKGTEADHVLLLTDISRQCARSMHFCHNADFEHRVFYVGVTRAKKSLVIVPPTKSTHYEI